MMWSVSVPCTLTGEEVSIEYDTETGQGAVVVPLVGNAESVTGEVGRVRCVLSRAAIKGLLAVMGQWPL